MNSLDTIPNEQKPADTKQAVRYELPLLSRDRALSLVRCATPAEANAVLSNVPAAAVAGITCRNVAIIWDQESGYAEPDAPCSAYAYKLCGQEPWSPFEHLDMAALPVKFESILERATMVDAAECELLTFLLPREGSEEPDDDEGDGEDDPEGDGGAMAWSAEPVDVGPEVEPEVEAEATWKLDEPTAEESCTRCEAEAEGEEAIGFDTEDLEHAEIAVVENPESVEEPATAPVAAAGQKKAAAASSDSVLTGNPLEGGGNAGGSALEPLQGHEKDRVLRSGTPSPAQAPRGLNGDQEGRQGRAGQGAKVTKADTPKKAEPKKRGAVATIAAKAAELAGGGRALGTEARAGAQHGDRDANIDTAVENAKRSAEIAASGHVRQVEHGAISR